MPLYDYQHQQARKRWAIKVAIEGYVCARCHAPRPPGSPFELDHADDGITYLGPSCPRCNQAAGGRKARRNDRLRRIRTHNW
jgi:DNA-directed RNA polymerase subunit RPC12/RpoP